MPSSAPVVALISPNGWLGRAFVPVFVDHIKTGDFAELRFITTKSNDELKSAIAENPAKIKVVESSYDQASLQAAFKDVDVIVNTMGHHGKEEDALKAIIEAAAAEGVNAYFPSEFGSDYDVGDYGARLFVGKKAHREAAEKAGLKTVALANSAFVNVMRGPFFGVEGNTWTLTGDGNISCAVTDMGDIARYTARAVVLVHTEPERVPRRLRVYSDLKTWNEYVAITEELTGEPITKRFVTQAELEERYRSGKEVPFFILRVLTGTKAHDFTEGSHNELLNPGQKYFKPILYEEFTKSQLKSSTDA